jgi:hypothetical protein
MPEDYQVVNRASWDERAPAHAAAPEYAVERFVTDPGFLSGVVRFDQPRLGDIRGLRGVHLQCHIGTDTLSLARLGAVMTGLDFSSASLEQARELARRTRSATEFVESDVYSAPDVAARRRLRPGLHRDRRAVLAAGRAAGRRGHVRRARGAFCLDRGRHLRDDRGRVQAQRFA